MKTNQVWKIGDCLELLPDIPDKSIDMILTDLPYGTTACNWDNIIDLNMLWEEYIRIIKSSGNIVLSASQPFTSFLLVSNPTWFSHSWIWEKEQGVNFLCSNNQPLKIHEDILVFRKPNSYGIDCFVDLRKYFHKIFNEIGLSKKQIVDRLGQGLDHCFRFSSNQWGLPTEKNYILLKNEFELDLVDYENLKRDYMDEFFRIYNPQKTIGKPYLSGKGNSGDVTGKVEKIQTLNCGDRLPTTILRFNRETGIHPTQKPIKLFEYLIKTYTNEGDTVHDSCLGSGTALEACYNLNRNCIGFEISDEWVSHYMERLRLDNSKLTDIWGCGIMKTDA